MWTRRRRVRLRASFSAPRSLPGGWSTPSGGGAHLTTTYEVDDQGRTLKVRSPTGRVDYTVYNDLDNEVRYYPPWDSTSNLPLLPITVSRNDETYNYSESLSVTATDGRGQWAAGDVDGYHKETFLQRGESGMAINQGSTVMTAQNGSNTAELKTDFMQSVGDAIGQYRFDRDPKPKGQTAEPLLSFPSGALVHYAISNSEVHIILRVLEFGREREGVDLSKVILTHHNLRNTGRKVMSMCEGEAPQLEPQPKSVPGPSKKSKRYC
jgi:hypothetical protein